MRERFAQPAATICEVRAAFTRARRRKTENLLNLRRSAQLAKIIGDWHSFTQAAQAGRFGGAFDNAEDATAIHAHTCTRAQQPGRLCPMHRAPL